MADNSSTGPIYDSKDDPEDWGSFVKMWLDALTQAGTEESDWRKDGEEAIETYRGKKKGGRSFNILHSNVETIGPALYNSTPSPDVRRRYADPDPVAKVVSDIIERALSFSIDNYDFDVLMKSVIRDGELTGRGIPRVRYVPTFGEPMMDANGEPAVGDDGQPLREVLYEAAICDYVPWRYFRRGPARSWQGVPWVAFGDFLTKDEVRKLNPDLADVIDYNYSAEHGNSRKVATEEQSIYKRALVWQIWDKDSRRVISIAQDYSDEPIAVEDDPLGLTDFFPVPRPYQPIAAPDSLTPIVPYTIYKDLVLELNDVTQRISRLVKQLRPRGIYGGQESLDIQAWAGADDGELVPSTNAAMIDGGMDKLIAWFPLDPVVKALQALVQQREMIKQTIYEVMGLGDILRGASHASETATAQQIKTQWGSLRIQDRQGEVARVVRDLFRLKAEIIATKFSWDTLSSMTGIVLATDQEKQDAQMQAQQQQAMAQQAQAMGQPAPPPAQIPPEQAKMLKQPSREDVEKVLRSDILRIYRVDVESDSTIRGDLSRNQTQMATFLQGTAQFAQAMGPIVQNAPEALPIMLEIYGAFARHYKLGKQAEDALDSLADQIRQAPPKDKQGDPKVEAAAAQAKADIEMSKLELQIAQQKHAMEMEKMQAQTALDQQKLQNDAERLQMEQQRDAHRLSIEQQRMAMQPLNQGMRSPSWAQETGAV